MPPVFESLTTDLTTHGLQLKQSCGLSDSDFTPGIERDNQDICGTHTLKGQYTHNVRQGAHSITFGIPRKDVHSQVR